VMASQGPPTSSAGLAKVSEMFLLPFHGCVVRVLFSQFTDCLRKLGTIPQGFTVFDHIQLGVYVKAYTS
jgi:hypothetical protein